MKRFFARKNHLVPVTLAVLAALNVPAAKINPDNQPLFVSIKVPALNMLVMGRDHRLYYEAYNDASDLDGDGYVDTRYKPGVIEYYGYFDSNKCYTYNGTPSATTGTTTNAASYFVPSGAVDDIVKKTCVTNDASWSGDFLNYLTTARIDAIRKVLYGGKRATDTTTTTVLERSYIPQDAHSWGKEYTSEAVDGFDISKYTPLSLPNANTRHFFANTTLGAASNTTNPPLLRVIQNVGTYSNANCGGSNVPMRIWHWLSIERPVANSKFCHGSSGPDIAQTITNYTVKVEVCKAGMLEENCIKYSSSQKPTGLLQEYGEDGRMLFGLLTGSNNNNLQGGVLRRAMGSIASETDANGVIVSGPGLINTLNSLRTVDFGSSHQYVNLHANNFATPMVNGTNKMWGNPLAEMMYEATRYMAGKGTPTSGYVPTGGSNTTTAEVADGLSLPIAAWDNPYDPAKYGTTAGKDGRQWCSKPFITTMSDASPSFDGEVPGSYFSTTTGDLAGFNASTYGNTLWSAEFGGAKNVFIGQSATAANLAPTGKLASTFANIRGLAPEDPTRQGTYYSAAVAAYARTNKVFGHPSEVEKRNTLSTFAVALASPLPRIEVPLSNGKKITFLPFAKSVGGSGISNLEGSYQPTDQIVDFYVESIVNQVPNENPAINGGRYKAVFQINFEDIENGNDHDMDAQVRYTISANAPTLAEPNGSVTVEAESVYAAGGIIQHMGFVVSGAGASVDGPWLIVRDKDTARASSPSYFLNKYPVPAQTGYTANLPLCRAKAKDLECNANVNADFSLKFTPGTDAPAEFLRDPLWYMAKYGGFADNDAKESALLNKLDDAGEWDAESNMPDGTPGKGVPDNYYLVVNPVKLKAQLGKAFQDIHARSASAASVATSSTSVKTNSNIYQGLFDSGAWTGDLVAKRLEVDAVTKEPKIGSDVWRAASKLESPDYANRTIYTYNPQSHQASLFKWNSLTGGQQSMLARDPDNSNVADTKGQDRLDFLRGKRDLEGTTFRKRGVSTLGPIVSSNPVFVPGSAPTVYVGANDGMLHAFDASISATGGATGTSGSERFAYVPSAVIGKLNRLTAKSYNHEYYVDGSPTTQVVPEPTPTRYLAGGLNAGGKGIYLLDITDPSAFSSSNIKWEFNVDDDADLGLTYARPEIVKMNNDKWAVVFGNGYDSDNERPHLYIAYLDGPTGAPKKWVLGSNYFKLSPLVSGINEAGNGLSSTASRDMNLDGKVDYIYAGDLKGNMWKFDVSSADSSQWKVAFTSAGVSKPLFVATDGSGAAVRQPITSRPELSLHPVYPETRHVNAEPVAPAISAAEPGPGVMVYFGTGKYMSQCDISLSCTGQPSVDSFYGIWDDDTPIVDGRSVLLRQTYAVSGSDAGLTTDAVMQWKTYATKSDTNTYMGWFFDMANPGERILSAPDVTAERIIFNTVIPSVQSCDFGGTGYLGCAKFDNGGTCGPLFPKIGAALGGLNYIEPPADLSLGDIRRIDQNVIGVANKTYSIASTTTGETSLSKLDLAKKIRRASWRELINE